MKLFFVKIKTIALKTINEIADGSLTASVYPSSLALHSKAE